MRGNSKLLDAGGHGVHKKIKNHYLPLTHTNASRSLRMRIAGFLQLCYIVFDQRQS